MIDYNDTDSRRDADRANWSSYHPRRRAPNFRLAGAASGVVLAVSALSGLTHESGDSQEQADNDAQNKAANIANNQELFGQDLPADPKDMAVTVDAKTGPYTVQPNDTAWDIEAKVDANVDGVPNNQEGRPLIDNITKQSEADGQPGLQPGETIQLPTEADRNLDPGVQLTTK